MLGAFEVAFVPLGGAAHIEHVHRPVRAELSEVGEGGGREVSTTG